MSFGFTAATWTAIGVGTSVVASSVIAADSQRKTINAQQDAINKAQQDDAIQTTEAKTQAALTANQKLAADKRARQANVLALGGNGDTLGGARAVPGSVLAGGAGAPAQRSAASVLGGGAPIVSAGSVSPTGYGQRNNGGTPLRGVSAF